MMPIQMKEEWFTINPPFLLYCHIYSVLFHMEVSLSMNFTVDGVERKVTRSVKQGKAGDGKGRVEEVRKGTIRLERPGCQGKAAKGRAKEGKVGESRGRQKVRRGVKK